LDPIIFKKMKGNFDLKITMSILSIDLGPKVEVTISATAYIREINCEKIWI